MSNCQPPGGSFREWAARLDEDMFTCRVFVGAIDEHLAGLDTVLSWPGATADGSITWEDSLTFTSSGDGPDSWDALPPITVDVVWQERTFETPLSQEAVDAFMRALTLDPLVPPAGLPAPMPSTPALAPLMTPQDIERLGRAVQQQWPHAADEHDDEDQDVTGRIIDDIDAAIEGICACGCGYTITSASESAWFASETCQRTWSRKQAIRPGQVLGGPDADQLLYAEQLAAERRARHPAGAVPAEPDDDDSPVDRVCGVPDYDPFDLAYTVPCSNCMVNVCPEVFEDLSDAFDIRAFGCIEPVRVVRRDSAVYTWECPECEDELPGPALFHSVDYGNDDSDRIVLTLSDGISTITEAVPRRLAPLINKPLVWEGMRRRLLAFSVRMNPEPA